MPFLHSTQPTLVLAPMEGAMDAPMRALIADLGGFDYAVSEFVRVGQNVVTAKQILEEIPDLNGPVFGNAPLPIQLQLLGDSPQKMAATAIEACIAGARAIDINFGCPADPARFARGSLGEKNNFGYPQEMKERAMRPITSAEKWGLSPLSSITPPNPLRIHCILRSA